MAEQKHHYIPEFYLKQWAGRDCRLIEFCRRHQKGKDIVVARPTYPSGTGYMRGLYTMRDAPQALKDILEDKYLNLADGIAALSLQVMLTESVVPTGPHKIGWTRFLMSLLYRTPEGVARTVEMVRKYYENNELTNEMKAVYATTKGKDDPGTAEEFMQLHGARIRESTTVRLLMKIIESEQVREKITGMQWHLGRLEGLRYPLLTSDRPMVMTNGLTAVDSHIIMPLSPKHIFIATNTDEEANKIKALARGPELAKRLNDRMARQARKFVYGLDADQLRFVESRLGEKVACSPFE